MSVRVGWVQLVVAVAAFAFALAVFFVPPAREALIAVVSVGVELALAAVGAVGAWLTSVVWG